MSEIKSKTIKIDPGTFVQDPFIECPSCHKISYGVKSIHQTHFERKCKDCWFESDETHSGRYYLPPLNKKIIYLDQFVICNFMKCLNKTSKAFPKIDPVWKKLFIKIDLCCKNQLITCPSSIFHENESLMMRDMFEEIKKMYDLLSAGKSFNHYTTIQHDQIFKAFNSWLSDERIVAFDLSLKKCLHYDVNTWVKGFFVTVNKNFTDDNIKLLINQRSLVHEKINKVWEDWLKVKKYDPEDYSKRQLKVFKDYYLDTYFDWLKSYRNTISSGTTFDPRMLFLPPEVSLIGVFKRQLEEKGIQDQEEIFGKIHEFFNSDISSSIPFLRIKTSMFKQLYIRAGQGQKRAPNQGFMNDIELISTLLPYCDAAFIDKECQSLLFEKEMKKIMSEFKTKIFSLKNIEEFEAYLEEIEGSQSKEHKVAIRNLYGEKGRTPYLTLYDKK